MINSTIQIVHILNDSKFVNGALYKYRGAFSNLFIFIETNEKYIPGDNNDVLSFSTCKSDRNKIVDICNSSDIVIIYGLDWIKARIINNINPEIIILWRFFGYEIYNEKSNLFLSAKTKKIIRSYAINKKKISSILKLKKTRNFYRELIIHKSISRINFIVTICKEEYSFLLTLEKKLPQNIVLPISKIDANPTYPNMSLKKKTIIIGNSRSNFNNHADILDITTNYVNTDYEFFIPFNYGHITGYCNTIKTRIMKLGNHNILDSYIDYNEYAELFRESSAFILNSKRQLGLGNLFLAIRNGVKIYLDEENVIFEWFKKNDIEVYPIPDISKDLDTNNTTLSENVAYKNIEALRVLYFKNTNEDYFKKLENLISK